MSLQSIMEAVTSLGQEIADVPVGDARLDDVINRIQSLEGELQREMGMHEPLVPDAGRVPSVEEATAEDLARALRSLRDAAMAKAD